LPAVLDEDREFVGSGCVDRPHADDGGADAGGETDE
jgi:hypothetical protein